MPSGQTHLAAQDRGPNLDASHRNPLTARSSQLAEENRALAESLHGQALTYEDFALELAEQINEFGIITSRAHLLAEKTRQLLPMRLSDRDAVASAPRSED